MKIIFNSQNIDLINIFTKLGKDSKIEVINAKVEKILFDHIVVGNVEAFIIENSTYYSQKAIDFVKKRHPYIPVVIFGDEATKIKGADIYIPFTSEDTQFELMFECIIRNIENYNTNFQKLQKLITTFSDIIQFGHCKYDPTRRSLYYKGKEIRKLSAKEGGIIEVLALNYGQVVKRDIILEKVWKQSDYFKGRSMDVYITNLRKLFKSNNIDLTINNISGVGLILEK